MKRYNDSMFLDNALINQEKRALDRLLILAHQCRYRGNFDLSTSAGLARCCSAWFQLNKIAFTCTGNFIEVDAPEGCYILEASSGSSALSGKDSDCSVVVLHSFGKFMDWYDDNF